MTVVQFFRKFRHFFYKDLPLNPVLALSTTAAMKQVS
jgi:hypothetical protein